LGSQNVLEENEPVLIVRPDDGPIGPKHVALYVLLMVIIDVLDENINTLFIPASAAITSTTIHVAAAAAATSPLYLTLSLLYSR